MNENEKFHQDEQNVSMEINEEALGDVSGGVTYIDFKADCTYCGKRDAWVYRGGVVFCSRCSRYYVWR